MTTLVDPSAAATLVKTPIGPLDQDNAAHDLLRVDNGSITPPSTAAPSTVAPSPTGPAPVPTQKARAGSLTPGGSFSKSELSSMAGSIASKLDQYLESAGANKGHLHDRRSSDSNSTVHSLTTTNVTQLGGNTVSDHNSDPNGSGQSNNGEVDEDTALANNLAAISLAAQKISNIYLEPKPKKTTPDGHQVTHEHFEPEKHFYPRVLNAQIHPMVGYFFSLGNERIIARYMHLNPLVNEDVLRKCLEYVPKHFQWAGK
ncbi:hypothetical protein BGX34_000510 [Mortierella sp. NVP85]|nr:hypothetical protein BGX34_000510 [Mortierella sp. NVP85]